MMLIKAPEPNSHYGFIPIDVGRWVKASEIVDMWVHENFSSEHESMWIVELIGRHEHQVWELHADDEETARSYCLNLQRQIGSSS